MCPVFRSSVWAGSAGAVPPSLDAKAATVSTIAFQSEKDCLNSSRSFSDSVINQVHLSGKPKAILVVIGQNFRCFETCSDHWSSGTWGFTGETVACCLCSHSCSCSCSYSYSYSLVFPGVQEFIRLPAFRSLPGSCARSCPIYSPGKRYGAGIRLGGAGQSIYNQERAW